MGCRAIHAGGLLRMAATTGSRRMRDASFGATEASPWVACARPRREGRTTRRIVCPAAAASGSERAPVGRPTPCSPRARPSGASPTSTTQPRNGAKSRCTVAAERLSTRLRRGYVPRPGDPSVACGSAKPGGGRAAAKGRAWAAPARTAGTLQFQVPLIPHTGQGENDHRTVDSTFSGGMTSPALRRPTTSLRTGSGVDGAASCATTGQG